MLFASFILINRTNDLFLFFSETKTSVFIERVELAEKDEQVFRYGVTRYLSTFLQADYT